MHSCIVLLVCLASFHSGFGSNLWDIKDLGKQLKAWTTVQEDAACENPLPKAMTLKEINPEIVIFNGRLQDTFRLYGENPNKEATVKEVAAIMAKRGFFAVGKQVVFITHGYMNKRYDGGNFFSSTFWKEKAYKTVGIAVTWMDEIKDAILKKEKGSTVILISWGSWGNGAMLMDYNQAAANTKTIASLISSFAKSILDTDIFKGNPNNTYLYCIGHSLGANICGQAGRMSGLFDRVSGLDPAGPGFETCWNTIHVDKDSAKCVDNIHTDGTPEGNAPVIPGVYHFGTLQRWGHVDFYPNNGTTQPGCTLGITCNHMAAIKFFQLSIVANKCTAQCDGSIEQSMGYYSSCHRNQPEVKEGSCNFTTGANSGLSDFLGGVIPMLGIRWFGKEAFCRD